LLMKLNRWMNVGFRKTFDGGVIVVGLVRCANLIFKLFC